jgi:hypothetical protein
VCHCEKHCPVCIREREAVNQKDKKEYERLCALPVEVETKIKFAWLPVRLTSGKLAWMRRVAWVYESQVKVAVRWYPHPIRIIELSRLEIPR